jgi:hypothetical protein
MSVRLPDGRLRGVYFPGDFLIGFPAKYGGVRHALSQGRPVIFQPEREQNPRQKCSSNPAKVNQHYTSPSFLRTGALYGNIVWENAPRVTSQNATIASKNATLYAYRCFFAKMT